MADIAVDLAHLLHSHFAAAGAAASKGGPASLPAPPPLRCLEAEVYQERAEWGELVALPSLEAALQRVTQTGLAEQVRPYALAPALLSFPSCPSPQVSRPGLSVGCQSRRDSLAPSADSQHAGAGARCAPVRADWPPLPSTSAGPDGSCPARVAAFPSRQLYYELWYDGSDNEGAEEGAGGGGGGGSPAAASPFATVAAQATAEGAAASGTTGKVAAATQVPASAERGLAGLAAAPAEGTALQVGGQAQQAQQARRPSEHEHAPGLQPAAALRQPTELARQRPDSKQEQPTSPGGDAYTSGFAAAEAAAALAELASLAGADWGQCPEGDDDGEVSGPESGGRAGASGTVRALRKQRGGRRARPAKLWCRHPLDARQWALVLGASVIASRSISLPWTNPGEHGAGAARPAC